MLLLAKRYHFNSGNKPKSGRATSDSTRCRGRCSGGRRRLTSSRGPCCRGSPGCRDRFRDTDQPAFSTNRRGFAGPLLLVVTWCAGAGATAPATGLSSVDVLALAAPPGLQLVHSPTVHRARHAVIGICAWSQHMQPLAASIFSVGAPLLQTPHLLGRQAAGGPGWDLLGAASPIAVAVRALWPALVELVLAALAGRGRSSAPLSS